MIDLLARVFIRVWRWCWSRWWCWRTPYNPKSPARFFFDSIDEKHKAIDKAMTSTRFPLHASTLARDVDNPPPPSSTSTTTTSTMARLDLLPAELVHLIVDDMPISALIALKLCNRALLHKIPLTGIYRLNTLSRCERSALRRYRHEYKELRDGRGYCVLCHMLQNTDVLHQGGGRVCGFHAVEPQPWARCGLKPEVIRDPRFRWERQVRRFCTHDRQVIWAQPNPPCQCGCQFCEHVDVEVFVQGLAPPVEDADYRAAPRPRRRGAMWTSGGAPMKGDYIKRRE